MFLQTLIIISIFAVLCYSMDIKSNGFNHLNDGLVHRTTKPSENGYEFEMMDLLGLSDRPIRMKRHLSLRNSASKFLLNVYNELNQDEKSHIDHRRRHKRAASDDNFITHLDRLEIEKCNHIISFSSKNSSQQNNQSFTAHFSYVPITFNTNNVPSDLQLMFSALRIYQDPALGRFHAKHTTLANTTISVYKRIYNRKNKTSDFKILTSINATTMFKGWLEFNVTSLLAKWLKYRTIHNTINGNQLFVSVTLQMDATSTILLDYETSAANLGLVTTNSEVEDLQPFIIGYFNGPELMIKIQKLRLKREVIKRKRNAHFYMPRRPMRPEEYKQPETCQRLNFTLDFKDDLHMQNWVIAPEKFEAFFCAGGCSFPLGSKMNATNHAIVQTLMHLRQPDLPKPCCVPTKLGAISILHYLNEDSVNLSKYPQSVARECGCH